MGGRAASILRAPATSSVASLLGLLVSHCGDCRNTLPYSFAKYCSDSGGVSSGWGGGAGTPGSATAAGRLRAVG